MIDPLISAVVTVLSWIITVLLNIAGFFSTVAYYAGYLPFVGSSLRGFFVKIQVAFSNFADNIAQFSTRVQNVLNAIDNWLDQLVDLINDVGGWISDKLDSAYTYGRNAINWIGDTGQDLVSDVYGWMEDKLNSAYLYARNAINWIGDAGYDLVNDVYGWITDKVDDAYRWADYAWDWIANFPSHVAEFLEPLKAELLQFLAPAFNLVSFFFEDINAFFSDPADYFDKRLERLGAPFAERIWAFFVKILERIW